MRKSKMTKRSFTASLVTLVVCVAMLIGTTFAWFTDTASTSVNKIQAGTLDVALEMSTDGGTKWESAEGKTLDFVKADAGKDQVILWEPGCTYSLPQLRVVNKGNLALKYKIQITGIKGDAKLNEAIVWTMNDGNLEEDHSLSAGATSQALTIEGHMQETAGNEYQGLSIDGIAITVIATQDTVEYDSTNNQYDANAKYPTAAVVVSDNQDDINAAIQNPVNGSGEAVKEVVVKLPSNSTVTLDNDIANAQSDSSKARTVTFSGDGTQTVDVITQTVNKEGGQLSYQRGSSFIFENVKVKAGEGNFDGIVCNELIFKNCTITGKLTLYGKATFIDCTFNNTMADQYSIWTWGGTDVTCENCTFNTVNKGKAILLYGNGTTNLVVNNCTFNNSESDKAEKAAIEIGNDYNATYSLSVNNATINGFAAGKNTGSTTWANKNSMDAEHLSVTIDGVKVQ